MHNLWSQSDNQQIINQHCSPHTTVVSPVPATQPRSDATTTPWSSSDVQCGTQQKRGQATCYHRRPAATTTEAQLHAHSHLHTHSCPRHPQTARKGEVIVRGRLTPQSEFKQSTIRSASVKHGQNKIIQHKSKLQDSTNNIAVEPTHKHRAAVPEGTHRKRVQMESADAPATNTNHSTVIQSGGSISKSFRH